MDGALRPECPEHQGTVVYWSTPGLTLATGSQKCETYTKLNMIKPSVWWVSGDRYLGGDSVNWSNLFVEQLAVYGKDFHFGIPVLKTNSDMQFLSVWQRTPQAVNMLWQSCSCPSLQTKFEPFDLWKSGQYMPYPKRRN